MEETLTMYGEFKGWLYPKELVESSGIPLEMDDAYLVTDEHNTIGVGAKTRLRDCMITDTGSTVGYLGEAGYFTTNTSGDTENGKDGMVMYDGADLVYYTMITVAHPTDSSGNYYKKWRGQITFANSNTYSTIRLGSVWNNSTLFTNDFATGTVGTLTPTAGDVYVLDWKIAVS